MKSSDADSAADPSPELPREWVRTIVSLLLFIHLFAVGLAILTTTTGESPNSDFLRDVKQKPRFIEMYLDQLWLNRGYDYALINNDHWDFQLDATIKYPDGRADEALVFPEPNMWPSERRQRYQQLGRSVGQNNSRGGDENLSEDEAAVIAFRKPLLPESIGAALMRQHPGADRVSLQCIFHEGIPIPELISTDSKDKNPDSPQYFKLAGNQTIVLDHGQPTVFDNLPAAETSPVKSNKAKAKPVAPAAGSPANSAKGGK